LLTTASELRVSFRRDGVQEKLVGRSFALIRESAHRVLGMRPFNVQLMGGFAMFKGMIAEMQTGEGKTLTATLPAATAALAGMPVHVITVNDYLAQRDADTMTPLYQALGLSVGVVVHGMSPDERRAAYGCDITYCTNKELTFDYLRDQMVLGDRKENLRLKMEKMHRSDCRLDRLVLSGLSFAIIDEADSVLIDEARTPLIISGEGDIADELERSKQALDVVGKLTEGEDYRVRYDERGVELSDRGKNRLRQIAESLSGMWAISLLREELATQALAALLLFHRDEQYLVQDDKVQIIDEYTGRVMADRFWSEGLHQLIEVKENCPPSGRRLTLARITYQRFFRRYHRVGGMTGTANEVAREFWSVFRLPVVKIPTHRPCRRTIGPVHLTPTASEKWAVVAARAVELQRSGVPVLIGTRSVAASEELSTILSRENIDHHVLSAAQDTEEAEIIASAGEAGRITVATNMAGRGTDIILAAGVADCGGLHVILSERHDAGRIDRQLIGRSARQGDPGHAEFILSLEDTLLEFGRTSFVGYGLQYLARRFGGRWGETAFFHAQRRAEKIHSRMRRDLLKLDEKLGQALAFSGAME
jgi:preprotein translocase subunit SecA